MAARSAGRVGGTDEARELVALVASLSGKGASINVPTISQRLGVSPSHARRLMGLILTAGTAGGDYLSLSETDDGGGLELAFSDGIRGRRLRLTRSELAAVLAALDATGIGRGSPLREEVVSSLSSTEADEDLLRRMLVIPPTEAEAAVLLACARARRDGSSLRFSYVHVGGGATERRWVSPTSVRQEGDRWYLDAYDVERRGERVFRADRMSEVEPGPPWGGDGPTVPEKVRWVRISIPDASMLGLLSWRKIRVESQDPDGSVTASIPYYGGSWLPRMLAACGGSAASDDPGVNASKVEVARALLGLADELNARGRPSTDR